MASISPAAAAVERLATGALGPLMPLAALDAALASDARPRRNRKLPARLMLLFCVLMNLYADEALPHVLRRVAGFWGVVDAVGASAGALCQARYRLGARPVVALFRQLCHPLATPATPGAFLFGLRLLALDGGRRLLRSTGPGTLVLWDRGFQNVAMVEAVQARGADFLGRLPATVRPAPAQGLADGTQLVRLRPCDHPRCYNGAHIVVRPIRYTLDDPQRPGHRLEHRLVTTLRDPSAASARELIRAYHRLPLPAAAPGRG